MTEPVRPLTPVERVACRLLAKHQRVGDLVSRLCSDDDPTVVSAVLAMSFEPGIREAVLGLLRGVQALGDAGLLVAGLPAEVEMVDNG